MRHQENNDAAAERLAADLREQLPEIDGRGLWSPCGLESWPWPMFLRRLRRRCGLTRRQLAERAGMSQSAVSDLEGGRDARLGTMERLLAAMACELVLCARPRRGLETLEENWPAEVRKARAEPWPGEPHSPREPR